MLELLVVLSILNLIAFGYLIYKSSKNSKPVTNISLDTTSISNQLNNQISKITTGMNNIPEQVLHTITGSANSNKGKLGELVSYLKLKAEYDRIIPLGTIVDFMCLKFPEGDNPGHVDFLDIKTGQSARLNKDQKALKLLIQNKQINFRTIKIEDIDNLEQPSSDTEPT